MKVVLGTMTFGGQVDEPQALAMMQTLKAAGHRELDTAHVYSDGKTEAILGGLLAPELHTDYYIASKVHPWNDDGLQPAQVTKQFNESLHRLKTDSIDLLYLHAPDAKTPIEDTLSACWELYQAGKFKDFGLSNYSAWQVAEIAEICRSNGWMRPSVYQGMYNGLTRDVEAELFPCLRHYSMAFYAYNPLAGGLLTGKHQQFKDMPEDGRFANYKLYPDRYWKEDYFQVLDVFLKTCDQENISPTDAAIRWLANHSMLSAEQGDAIVLGASKLSQLDDNLNACAQGSIPDSISNVLDQGWDVVRPNCTRYFRS